MKVVYKILVDDRDINDATSFYIDIIHQSIITAGFDVSIVKELSDITYSDVVVVVKVTSAYRVLKKNKRQNVIIWLQGIQPEEMRISDYPFLKKYFYYYALRYLEWYSFKHIPFMIYVSKEMKRHYEKLYSCNNKIDFLMPCFNLELDYNSFSCESRYKTPSFVYAGSLDTWQCFEKTLDVFRMIKHKLPKSTLTILTKEIEKAKEISLLHGLNNVKIKYVAKDNVQEELTKYKYGFIIRDNIEVNKVATPTKLNSYMASGVIPIVSESLYDFIENTIGCKYICKVSNSRDISYIAEQIIDFDKLEINNIDIKEEYEVIFSKYYNKEYYISKLSKVIIDYQNSLISNI